MNIDWERIFSFAAFAGNIAQVVSAALVLAGGILIIQQLKQIRTEQRHKKWEALQWLLGVANVGELQMLGGAIRHLSVSEHMDALFTNTPEAEELRAAIRAGERKLEVISAALQDGYGDKHLYFQLRGRELRNIAGEVSTAIELYREMYGNRHNIGWINNLSEEQAPVYWLLDEVTEWSARYKPVDPAKVFTHDH